MLINELLEASMLANASDLHLSAELPPIIRLDGELKKLKYPILGIDEIKNLFYSLMTEKQCQQLEHNLELDFAFEILNVMRCRVSIFHQARGLAGVFRLIPQKINSLMELNLPAILARIADFKNGLVLICGATGCGKTTTLAALIDFINQQQNKHIITIEDPIEFMHQNKNSLINQREVSRDTFSFNTALRSALRSDPDVILLGELRDLETTRLAITAAETGHLVFATLHTQTAAKAIHRIIDLFPASEKNNMRSILAETLQAVVCQTLVKKIAGGRIAALELLLNNSAIRNLIREDKIAQIYATIQTSIGLGMQTLDQHLQELVRNKIITTQIAKEAASNKEFFNFVTTQNL